MESASSQPVFDASRLGMTLGAAFIGNIFAAILFGLTTMQTITYFRSPPRDAVFFRVVVICLWLLDTFHLILVTHGIYYYVIDNFANPIAILRPTWSLVTQIYITVLIILVVRSVFTARIWILSYGNKFLVVIITLTSLFVFGTGYGFASIGFGTTFKKLFEESWMLYASLGGAVAADLMIALSLCYLLMRNRTGFKRTDSLVTTLLVYAVNTGLLTSVCATACFITYTVWPQDFIFMGIYFSLGKMYLNAMLASLNARDMLLGRKFQINQTSGVISTVPDTGTPPGVGLTALTNTASPASTEHLGTTRLNTIKSDQELP